MVAKKIEAALDPADESFVGVLLQIERAQALVDDLHSAAQLPAALSKMQLAIVAVLAHRVS
ncbi:MAG: hypothetical protein WEA28_03090 [Xanthobacteraceae bacterium]|jgi:hypothetical protein